MIRRLCGSIVYTHLFKNEVISIKKTAPPLSEHEQKHIIDDVIIIEKEPSRNITPPFPS